MWNGSDPRSSNASMDMVYRASIHFRSVRISFITNNPTFECWRADTNMSIREGG